jgi:hypothetical protein
MTIRYDSAQWRYFCAHGQREQNAVGSAPAAYAKIAGYVDETLSPDPLTRHNVINLCQSGTDPWNSFINIMAWGSQDRMARGQSKVRSMFAQRDRIVTAVEQTMLAQSREEAFRIWAESGIRDLWVAYFTKVLFFFLYPRLNCYIMDQWTASAVNLLCEERIVTSQDLHSRAARRQSAETYSRFCDLVDEIAAALPPQDGGWSGAEAEAALFCRGGRKRMVSGNPASLAGPWRLYVRENIGPWAP